MVVVLGYLLPVGVLGLLGVGRRPPAPPVGGTPRGPSGRDSLTPRRRWWAAGMVWVPSPHNAGVGRRRGLSQRGRAVARRPARDPGRHPGCSRRHRGGPAPRGPAHRHASRRLADGRRPDASSAPRTGARSSWRRAMRCPGTCPSATTGCTRHDDGHRTAVIVSPGRCLLPTEPAVGLGRAALRRPLAGELGHRRPRRPAPLDRLVGRELGAGLRRAQPAARRRAGVRPAAQPVLPEQPPVPQPALPPRRGRARGGRGRRRRRPADAGGRRPGPERRPTHRPRRRLRAEDATRSSGSGTASPARRPGVRRVLASQEGAALDEFATFCVARRAPRRGRGGLAGRATAIPTPPASPGSPAHHDATRPVPRVAAVAPRRPARPAADGVRRDPRPRRSASTPAAPTRGLWQDVLASSDARSAPRPTSSTAGARTGASRRSSRGSCAPPATGRSSRPCGRRSATAAACGSTTSWACSGCSGSRGASPARGHLRPLPGRRPARHRSPSRATGPGRSSSARTSAPSRSDVRAELAGAQRAVLPAAVVRARRRPSGGPSRRWPRSRTHDLPTVAGLWTGADLEAQQRRSASTPNEEGAAATRRHLQDAAGVDDDATAPTRLRSGRLRRPWPARRPCSLAGHARRRPGRRGAARTCPAPTDEWPNWSIALPVPLEEIERRPHVRSAVAELLPSGPPRRG